MFDFDKIMSQKGVIASRVQGASNQLHYRSASLRKSSTISLGCGRTDRYTQRVSRGVDFVPNDCLKNARSASLLFLAFLPTWKIDARKFWRDAICQVPFSEPRPGGQRAYPIYASFPFNLFLFSRYQYHQHTRKDVRTRRGRNGYTTGFWVSKWLGWNWGKPIPFGYPRRRAVSPQGWCALVYTGQFEPHMSLAEERNLENRAWNLPSVYNDLEWREMFFSVLFSNVAFITYTHTLNIFNLFMTLYGIFSRSLNAQRRLLMRYKVKMRKMMAICYLYFHSKLSNTIKV